MNTQVPPTAANLREQATLCIESFTDRRLQLYDCEPLRHDLLKLRVEEKSYGIRLTSPRDGEGHGDTFSAFSLALLIAHELAGRKPTRVGALSESSILCGRDFADIGGVPVAPPLDGPPPNTPMGQAYRDMQYLEAAVQRDYALADQLDADHQLPFRLAMDKASRVNLTDQLLRAFFSR